MSPAYFPNHFEHCIGLMFKEVMEKRDGPNSLQYTLGMAAPGDGPCGWRPLGLAAPGDGGRSPIRLPMEEWYWAVNAPVAFTARKYLTNPSAVVRLN
jgi:hypothetical protein